MMNNILLFEMPVFQPEYKRWKKYGYKNAEEKKNLQEVLETSTGGYCMYCYSRIRVDGKMYANLEHAVEKSNSVKLAECIPDIGLACTVCNQRFKRMGEKKRKLPSEIINIFEQESSCTPGKRKQCTVPCKALRKLQKQYNNLPAGKIILQPMGAKGNVTGERLALQYDVLNMEFQPANSFHTYFDEEQSFIEMHIRRFQLNDPQYRTRQLFYFIKNIIDNHGKIPQYEYNNLVVEQFCKKLEHRTTDEILKICESIYCIVYAKM